MLMFEIGVIPAAGRGLRLTPYTEDTPKVLFEIGGVTLLERNIVLFRDKLKLKKIYIILGHLGHQISDKFGDGSGLGIELHYVNCEDPSRGLAEGLLVLKDLINQPFIMSLGDELYLNSNHECLLDFAEEEFDAVCAYKLTGDVNQIKQNYSIEMSDGKITRLVEKPQIVENNFLGCGTFILKPDIFSLIESTVPSSRSRKIEFIDTLNKLVNNNGLVLPMALKGEYKNINYSADFIAATHLYRKVHFSEYKISLVIPAYNEEASLAYVIDDFKESVDEVVVAASYSADKTVEIAQENASKVLVDNFLGYGDALKAGMNAASGDIIILVEADASFSADDLPKLLSYLKDADLVMGTRTTKQLIQQGANMDGFLRWGNVMASKILQLLWLSQEPRFTDLGCTYRAIWRECYEVIRPNLHAKGPEFSPEMMVETMKAKRKIVEIPVTYRPRIGGESKHSHDKISVLKTGCKMLGLIIRKWLGR
jgi:NDP-sugar pyrophosphorylase family protein